MAVTHRGDIAAARNQMQITNNCVKYLSEKLKYRSSVKAKTMIKREQSRERERERPNKNVRTSAGQKQLAEKYRKFHNYRKRWRHCI